MTRKLYSLLLILSLVASSACTPKTSGKYKYGTKPSVTVSGINTGTVKKYEKFEALIDLKNVRYDNPYDPADVDISAEFTAPSGEKFKVFGFFDDYKSAGKWKIRFSPAETGEYKYKITVKDGPATGETGENSFSAVESEHHGWIKQSPKNPHYFAYNDGKTYYGVGAYSPWGNSEKTFKTLKDNKANFMAIWDINYGGFVNSAGIIEEKLGQYNQEKLGQIDSLLSILENDNIQLMFAIWPHDLFSETVWAAQWKLNPYSTITKSENVYSDSLAWEYQKMKYRYLIARFAHSRSWGIWELINEMDGTDGWAKGHHEEAFDWVRKCVNYFAENDPYRHPVTASFSGGFEQYREPLYEMTDVPNIHLYPAQGWKLKFPDDSSRSDMYNFGWAAKRFWDKFQKPAIFGEAGADLTYYKPDSKEYRISYHNQIWASLTNGLAVTPVWWDFSIMKDQDWEQIRHLSEFVADIDFANLPFLPAEAETRDADVYVMDGGSSAFGWIRAIKSPKIDGHKIILSKPEGNYNVIWFDTWTGDTVKAEQVASGNGKLTVTVPAMSHQSKDIAFKISTI